MAAAHPISTVPGALDIEAMTADYIRQWCGLCDRFNEWQHKHIIGQESSTELFEGHRQGLKWLLRLTKLMHYTLSDPEFPDRSLVELLETKIWQLEQAWKILYRQRSQKETEEAESVLREIFPDEPRT